MSWMAEMICGIIGIVIGLALLYVFWNCFLIVLKGVIGFLILVIGALFVAIALEDRRTEKVFKETEEETKEEEEKEES